MSPAEARSLEFNLDFPYESCGFEHLSRHCCLWKADQKSSLNLNPGTVTWIAAGVLTLQSVAYVLSFRKAMDWGGHCGVMG